MKRMASPQFQEADSVTLQSNLFYLILGSNRGIIDLIGSKMIIMKKAYMIHGWDGTSEENWFPWLRRELESKGFEVIAPQMPDADLPRIKKWVSALKSIVKDPDENTYFVGHSMGC